MIDWRDLASDRAHVRVFGGGLRHFEGETPEGLFARDRWELREDIVQCSSTWVGTRRRTSKRGRSRIYLGFTTTEDPFQILEEIATRDLSRVPGAVRELLDRAETLSAKRAGER